MRVAAVVATALVLGAAALLRGRRREREENANLWSAATDALGLGSAGGPA